MDSIRGAQVIVEDIVALSEGNSALKAGFRSLSTSEVCSFSGEGGIRTLGGPKPTTVFETVPFNHSGTSPNSSAKFEVQSSK